MIASQSVLDPFLIPGYLGTKSLDQIKEEKTKPTVISLFTGAGGFDLGMSQAGFETRVMIEWSKHCCETLRANWHWSELQKRIEEDPECVRWKSKEDMKKDITWYQDREPVILERDITTLTTREILDAAGLGVGEATAVIGGPPCQGFSTSNMKRFLEDPRNRLFLEFVRIVREALPRTLIIENVPGMVTMAQGAVIRQVCEEFANSGYNITWDILNAADYGVPQTRRRVFIIGTRVDMMYFPEIGNPRLHMGAYPGEIHHPEWFLKKKYKKREAKA
jgi:DNA (cytosine-5)-methyltransferase 1